jgi:hypothetical protein
LYMVHIFSIDETSILICLRPSKKRIRSKCDVRREKAVEDMRMMRSITAGDSYSAM